MNDKETVNSISREELYELVWKTPMLHLAKEYGLSDVGLAKLCRRHDIPTPPVGYWAKLAHGKEVIRPKLPSTQEESSIDLKRERQEPVEVPLAATFFDPEIGTLAEEEQNGPAITVTESLRSHHPAVARTREALGLSEKSRYRNSDSALHPYGGREEPLLDITVGKSFVNRALRIFDAVIKACESRGYRIGPCENAWEHGLRIYAFGQPFQLKIREPSKRTLRELDADEKERLRKNPHAYISNKYEYLLTGALQLELSRHSLPVKTLRDGKKRKIEDGLSRLMMAILREVDDHRKHVAEAARKEELRREEQRKKQEEAERRRLEEEKRKQEQARVDELVQVAEAWRQSQTVRDYLIEARAAVLKRNGRIDEGGDIERWFQWAHYVVESIDPLSKVRASSRQNQDAGQPRTESE